MRPVVAGLIGFARRDPAAAASALVLALFVAMALFPPVFTTTSPTQQNLRSRLQPPSAERNERGELHLLGTDHLGRDILSRVVHGARTSLAVALASFIGAGTIGLILGSLAGFYGGWVDDVLTFWSNVQLGFPFLLVAMVLLVFVPPGIGSVVFVLIITTWVQYARVVRGVVLSIRDLQYVEAARAAGASDLRLLFRYVLPSTVAPFLVIGTLEMARVIVLEASLSFLGLGVPPPTPTWGGMLSEGRGYMLIAPWLATVPGIAITVLVISINAIGDSFRDIIDPYMQK